MGRVLSSMFASKSRMNLQPKISCSRIFLLSLGSVKEEPHSIMRSEEVMVIASSIKKPLSPRLELEHKLVTILPASFRVVARKYWCDFSSVLFAQFYNTDGEVSGSGDASLQFLTTRRRLGQEQRRLQEGPGTAGMDLSIDVNGETEGPGDLKTAGGASKATVFAS